MKPRLSSLVLVLLACGETGATGTDTPNTATGEVTGGAPTTSLPTEATASELPDTTAAPGSTGLEPATGTSEACACEPGAALGCAAPDLAEVCAEDCMDVSITPCPEGQLCLDGACAPAVCEPGAVSCTPDGRGVHTCAGDGRGHGPPVECGADEACEDGACASLCTLATAHARSTGCSFFVHALDGEGGGEGGGGTVHGALVVTNAQDDRPATLQLYTRAFGLEVPVGDPVVLGPGAMTELALVNPPIESGSALREDGGYHLQSDVPVAAVHHGPGGPGPSGDASLLLPEHALGTRHVVAAGREGTTSSGHLGYFVVIAAADRTLVRWTPPVLTLGGPGVPEVQAGDTGEVALDRLQVLQVAAPTKLDLSGTLVVADLPVWVVGGAACASVPATMSSCDHVEEQLIPLDRWGTSYVAARAPARGGEAFHWRVYAGADAVTITTLPDQTGGPVVLSLGESLAFTSAESFVVTGDGPFLPVQLLESRGAGADLGDPAAAQLVPVEQFERRYTLSAREGDVTHSLQVIRALGGPEVLLDGAAVGGYAPLGAYEVADWPLLPGPHVAASEQPFGVVRYGHSKATAYAYPGGLRLAELEKP